MASSNDKEIVSAVRALKIGKKIRELRLRNRFTLQDLADRTGLSKPFLSQIENSHVIPPLPTLLKVSRALDVNLSHFFRGIRDDGKFSITRSSERTPVERRSDPHGGEGNYSYVALETKKTDKKMLPLLVEFPFRDSEAMTFTSHKGEEFLFVIEGRVEFRTPEGAEELEPGDCIYMESDLDHGFRRLSDTPARAIAVVWMDKDD